jgi:hypothetical protein
MSFPEWSATRIVLLSVAWVVSSLALLGWRTSRLLRDFSAKTGSGIVAISGGIFETAAVLFGPPLLLAVLWFIVRRPLP